MAGLTKTVRLSCPVQTPTGQLRAQPLTYHPRGLELKRLASLWPGSETGRGLSKVTGLGGQSQAKTHCLFGHAENEWVAR